MIAIRTILAATDFSGCADAALDLALDVARRQGASLRLLHVREPNGAARPGFGGGHPLSRAWEMDLLQAGDMREITLAWDHVPVTAEVEVGSDATDAILEAVQHHDVDLLVMGTHGQHSVHRFLNDTPDAWSIGLTAREVLSETRCPVLAVGPRHDRYQVSPREIVAGVDDSPQAASVIEHAAAIAASYATPLCVVHVAPTGSGRVARSRVRQELVEKTRSLVPSVVPFDVQVPDGRPAEGLVRFVRHRPGVLLVVASHGHRSRGAIRIGSVADAVVRSAPCPVMTVKPFGKSLVDPLRKAASHLVATPTQSTGRSEGTLTSRAHHE